MKFNPEDIEKAICYVKALNIPDNFGDADETAAESLDVERLALDLHNAGCHGFHIFHGVSKAVINIIDLPFVIKIPFNGMWYYDYDIDDGETNYFSEFMYAGGDNKNDYCDLELTLSESAIEKGFGKIVAYTMWLGHFNGRDFYLQEKVVPFDEEPEPINYSSQPSRDKAAALNLSYKIGSPAWIAAVIEDYGEEFWKSFVDWGNLEDNGILSDLHARNYGFRYDGTPVIFDIGGFSD